MDPIFDAALVTRRRLRALRQPVAGAEFLMRRVSEDLSDRLGAVQRRFELAADLFSASALPAATVAESGKVARVARVEAHSALLNGDDGTVSPPETLPFEPASLDLAVSVLAMHEMNDLPGVLAQARRALKPDGLLLAALAGQGTLAELRESLIVAETELSGGAAPRVAPFADIRDMGGLLQRAGFALPVVDIEPVTVRYDTMFDLIRDLRGMGWTSSLVARPRKPATRALFARAAQVYAERFSDPDGRVRATFSIVWMSGWVPHASQQKPMRPGTAKHSLAEALKKVEGDQ
ncbi:MAG: methyltransferase domain-containing protein [Rhizobiaceae bacterium]|nr:methyltransferase domain-containing protein [Rhizobiaceae bacterium]